MKLKSILIDWAKRNVAFRRMLRMAVNIRNGFRNISSLMSRVDDHLIIFESYKGKSYSCSPRAIYEEMINNPMYSDYKFIWVFKDPLSKKDIIKDKLRTTLVKYKSKEYYQGFGRAKYWFVNSRLPFELHKKVDQVYVQCWHGTPLKRLGNDIVEDTKSAMSTKTEISRFYDRESKRLDYFISPSIFATEKFISSFNLKKYGKENAIIEKGYPRNDFLINYTEVDVKMMRDKLGIPTSKKVILYAPTFRDNEHLSGVGYTYELNIDFDYLKEKLSDEYVILYRPHYFVVNGFNYEKYEGFVIDISNVDDMNQLYIISDILITDYSSVFFDYAILKRPIIFYMYDLDFYKNDLRGFYVDLNTLPGKIITRSNEIDNIIRNLENYNEEYKGKYDALNAKYNYLDDGRSSKRVVEHIFGGSSSESSIDVRNI